MPANAHVPGDALPRIDRFRGHGPLLQERWMRHPLSEWALLL